MPQRPPWPTAALASPLLLLALQGCASPMTASDPATYPPPGHLPPTPNRIVDGPLRFWQHNFGAYCFSTWGCRVRYGSHLIVDRPPSEWQEPLEAATGDMRARMRGGHIGLRNFEGPVTLEWHDAQRTPQHLSLDLAELFADGLIRHNVPANEIRESTSVGNPDIIVEINDRTVRVYMRAHIPLKKPRDAANPYSDFVEENILVFERAL
ncbi:MAG: hypothetical protein EPO46_02745 [Lysobacter sp.]|nr:MAG: hypothetical protein EPO46_02745 [Lysobacter sp.]